MLAGGITRGLHRTAKPIIAALHGMVMGGGIELALAGMLYGYSIMGDPQITRRRDESLRRAMINLRLAELREGVWLRPDNLTRPVDDVVAEQCAFFRCEQPDPADLARQLWDLRIWADTARSLYAELGQVSELPEGFVLIAEAVRHLRLDPCLPPELLPPDWPGQPLRERFTAYRDQFALRLREYSTG